jgi:hypothetical protein
MPLVRVTFGITILIPYNVVGVWEWEMYSLWKKYFETEYLWRYDFRGTTVNR